MTNYIIYPNGWESPVFPIEKDGKFTVMQLQDIVGGYIGLEDIGEEVIVFNDEGQDCPYNRKASELIQQYGHDGILSGPVLILERDKIKT